MTALDAIPLLDGSHARLSRFAVVSRPAAFWAAMWSAAGDHRVRRADAGHLRLRRAAAGVDGRLPRGRRLVRRLRPGRVAAPPGQPRRHADDRDRLRALRLAGARPGRLTDGADRGRPVRGRLGHPDDHAAARVPHRRPARTPRATACWSARSCSSSSWSSRCTPSTSCRATSCCSPRTRTWRWRSTRPVSGSSRAPASRSRWWSSRAGARRRGRAAAPCSRASPASLPAAVRAAAGRALRAHPLARGQLAVRRPGGVPGRAAAFAARARRPRRPPARRAHDARPRARAGAGPHARRSLAADRVPGAPAIEPGPGVLRLESDGRVLAALVYDPSLDEDPELVRAVGAAAAIALENEDRVRELQDSRERIVTAGDDERRRLERNLHDGAQQRLVGIALQLRLLRNRVGDDPAARRARRPRSATSSRTRWPSCASSRAASTPPCSTTASTARWNR